MKAHVLAASLLLIAIPIASSPIASRANNGGGATCGKAYTTSSYCHLMFRGFPLIVRGDASVSSGTAQVHVWLTLYDADDPNATIVECSAQHAGFASCGTGFPDSTTLIDNYAFEQTSLVCHVQARGSGTYVCSSGNGA